MSRLLYFTVFMLVALTSFGQLKFSDAEILVNNQFVWRGKKFGTGISIQPSATVASGKFSFCAWSALTTNNSYSELDLIPSYQFDYFSVTLLDYYIPEKGESNNYLNFQGGKSRHSLELNVDNYSIEDQRFKWMIGTYFAGDKNKDTGNPNYSTYIEIKYPFTVLKIDAEPFVGLTPFKGAYADKFALINSGVNFSKELDFKLPFTIPLNLSFVANPYTEKTFIIFGAGIAF